MRAKKKARENVMKFLYEIDMNSIVPTLQNYNFEIVDEQYETKMIEKIDVKFCDEIIVKYLKNWSIDRIGFVNKAILRLAITEMFFMDEIDDALSINEAVNLSKKFSDPKSPKFINGVLGNIQRNERIK